MKYIILVIFLIHSCNYSFSQKAKIDYNSSYLIVNSAYAFPYKATTAGYILRKLYGNAFNKWVDIEQDREVFSYNYIWSMNNTAEYMTRLNCSMLCGEKPQILNISLDSWLNPKLDSIVLEYEKPDSAKLKRDPRFILISNGLDKIDMSPLSDTIILYHENPWCRAFKYLVIQHIFSATLGSNFDANCLSQDGSQQANLGILGNNKDYLQITKDVASDLFSQYDQATYMKKAQFFYPAFEFIWDTKLDTIAGKYYNEYMEIHKKK